MKENLTEIVTILDHSGSMANLTGDTIGGYNNFISEQKKLPGEAVLTTVLFNNGYTVLHDGIPIQNAKPITTDEYRAEGSTALLDAIGKTVNKIGTKLHNTEEQNRPSKVIVLIVTDGEENSSKEFTHEQIKEMVKRQQDIYSWQFLFFGANIDSFDVGQSIGVNIKYTADFSANGVGVHRLYNVINCATTSYRSTGEITESYKKDII
jgi:uncharacterized protein YegL